jgi:hypothetical protein
VTKIRLFRSFPALAELVALDKTAFMSDDIAFVGCTRGYLETESLKSILHTTSVPERRWTAATVLRVDKLRLALLGGSKRVDNRWPRVIFDHDPWDESDTFVLERWLLSQAFIQRNLVLHSFSLPNMTNMTYPGFRDALVGLPFKVIYDVASFSAE